MKRITVLMCVAASGCVSATPGAQNVVLTSNLSFVAGCKFLGQETANAMHLVGVATTQKDVATTLRNKAAAMGGTHVITSGPTMHVQGGLAQTGDIYRC